MAVLLEFSSLMHDFALCRRHPEEWRLHSPMMLVRMLIELITIMAVEKPVHALTGAKAAMPTR
jgi:hypothetical protein